MNACRPPTHATQRFQDLYKSRFGVDSKPEHIAMITKLHLAPEEGLQFMEDLISLIQQVFDDYFDELKVRSKPNTQ